MQEIRAFPRRTNWTPDDDLSFVGMPAAPIAMRIKYGHLPVCISVAFTWDIPAAERMYRTWLQVSDNVELGGPAFDDPGGEFVPGRFVKHGVTITSRGCGGSCGFCLVPMREGEIRELVIHDGWDVADNNLLACSQEHILAVFEMLRRQPLPIKFSGGLDARLFKPWHADLLTTIRLKYAWFACDGPGSIEPLREVARLLDQRRLSIEKRRCYVLIGFGGESMQQSERRLHAVYKLGFLPMAMLYRKPDTKENQWAKEWRDFQKFWSRPAIYRSTLKQAV